MSANQEHVRALSQALFGQRYRLEVMVAIARSDGLVCLTDLARSLDVGLSNVQKPIASLVQVGLISRMPTSDSRRRYYRRNPGLAWDYARETTGRAADWGLAEVGKGGNSHL